MANLGQPFNLSPTRLAIVRLLKEWGKGTVKQLSEALGISRIAVHQHLSWLKSMGLVESEVERQGRGRPSEVFTLTESAQEHFFPRRYDLLALTVLDEVASQFGEEFLLQLFRRYRERLAKQLGRRKGSLRERVKSLADFLAEEGYLARWEETRDGFILSLPNCPIAQIAKRFQQACTSEVEMLRKVLGAPVTRECHQVVGDSCCRYFIAKPGSRKTENRRPDFSGTRKSKGVLRR